MPTLIFILYNEENYLVIIDPSKKISSISLILFINNMYISIFLEPKGRSRKNFKLNALHYLFIASYIIFTNR